MVNMLNRPNDAKTLVRITKTCLRDEIIDHLILSNILRQDI